MIDRQTLLTATLSGAHSLERAPKAQVVRDLLGLQAQFAFNPPLSLQLRASDYSPEGWADGLVKIWSHRGTLHVVEEAELGLYLSAADQAGPFRDGWWGMTAAQQARWAPFLLDQVRAGNDTRDALKRSCIAAGMDDALLRCVFYGWGGLIKELVWRGQLAAVPGSEKRYRIPAPPVWMDRDEARAELVRRYFAAFGPASAEDCAGFFGWKKSELKPVLAEVLPEMMECRWEGVSLWHARPLDGLPRLPDCVLLPGFDAAVLAYRDRSRMIDPAHRLKVTNAQGIVFPIVILRGKARARWKPDGDTLRVTPFERLLKRDIVSIRRAARRELGLRSVEIAPTLP